MTRRILYVSQQLPWPKHSGGNIRAYYLLEALAREHHVVLCSTSNGSALARNGERIFADMCAEVRIVPDEKQMSKLGQAKGVLRSLLRGSSAVLEHNANRALAAAVADVLATGKIDSIQLSQLDTAPYIDFETAPPVVVDTQNLLFDYYERRAVLESGFLRRWVCRREARLLRRLEPEIFRKAARVVVCSDTERDRLLELDGTLRVDVVANGVDCSAVQPQNLPSAATSRELVFVGDLGYGPNQDAALFFIREVLPIVQAAEPKATFFAVGKNPPEELVTLGQGRADLTVTGFVDDVAEWVERAEICVVPIRYGSGTRLKVLEAFAFEKPTVSTSIGAEGIAYTEGQDILIRDEPQPMAEAILGLFADPAKARSMALAARQTVEQQYDWKQIGERTVAIHGELG